MKRSDKIAMARLIRITVIDGVMIFIGGVILSLVIIFNQIGFVGQERITINAALCTTIRPPQYIVDPQTAQVIGFIIMIVGAVMCLIGLFQRLEI